MRDRLKLISQMVDSSIRKPQETPEGKKYMLRDLVTREIVWNAPQHGTEYEDACVSRVFWWIKKNVQYRQDPVDYDYYMAAGRTITSGAGDCDDHCVLNAAMLTSIGFRCGARIVSPDGANWHIYALAGVRTFSRPTAIIPMDTTQTESTPGWEPPYGMRKYEMQTTFQLGQLGPIVVNRWGGADKNAAPITSIRQAAGLF